MNHTTTVELAKRAAVVCAVLSFFVIIFLLAWLASDVLLVLFAGILLAVLFHSTSRFVSRYTHMHEKLALALVLLTLLVIGVGGSWLLVPTVTTQVQKMRDTLPQSVEKVRKQIETNELGRWALRNAPNTASFTQNPKAMFSRTTGVISGTLGAIGVVLLIFFLGILMAAQPELYRQGLLSLLPRQKRDRADDIMQRVRHALQSWLIAKLTAMLLIGFLTWLGLFLLGVELAMVLAILAALLSFVPNFGPIISAIPAVLLGLLQSPTTALWVIALYVGVQLLDNNLISPVLEYQALSMPPALLIVAQLTLAALAGVMGMVLAAPLLAVLVTLVRSLYMEDMLGEPTGDSA